MERVVVLVGEARHRVADVAGKVAHREGLVGAVLPVVGAARARLHEELVALVRRAHRVAKVLVGRAGLLARLVEQPKHARRRLLDEVDAALVVLVLDLRPRDALRLVQRLLALEDEAQEELLQLLVGKVDAELLKRVDEERLEAVDVQQPDERRLAARGEAPIAAAERLIDDADEPIEEACVDRLCQRVTSQRRLRLAVLGGDGFAARLHRARQQPRVECFAAQQADRLLQCRLASLGELRLLALCIERRVAQLQQPRDDAQAAVLLLVGEPHLEQRVDGLLVLGSVVDAIDGGDAALVEVGERLGPVRHAKGLSAAAAQLVEDVVVALSLGLEVDARLLEQVLPRRGAEDIAAGRDADLDKLAEAARVVVAARLCVAKGLKHRVGLQNPIGEVGDAAASTRAVGEVAHQVLVGLGLARTRLAAHDERLRLARFQQRPIGLLGHGVGVRLAVS